jgi:hypothetical protein
VRDPHDVLGVPEGSSPETIKAVYRQLARAYRRSRSRRRTVGEETEMVLGLRLAGIDLGGLVGVSVVVQRRALLEDPPEAEEPPRPVLRKRSR